jgi:hypothetical protein
LIEVFMQVAEILAGLEKEGVVVTASALGAYLKGKNIAVADVQPQGIKAIAQGMSSGLAPVGHAPKNDAALDVSTTPRPRGKVGARQAIADVVSQRDTVVADLMVRTGEIASAISNPVAERKAQELGQALGQAQVKAIDEVGDFLLGTLGNSQWLLTGAMDVLDGEIVS